MLDSPAFVWAGTAVADKTGEPRGGSTAIITPPPGLPYESHVACNSRSTSAMKARKESRMGAITAHSARNIAQRSPRVRRSAAPGEDAGRLRYHGAPGTFMSATVCPSSWNGAAFGEGSPALGRCGFMAEPSGTPQSGHAPRRGILAPLSCTAPDTGCSAYGTYSRWAGSRAMEYPPGG